ncbi:hypothetical protein ACFOWM_06675 [Ferruginibacter yonginensis]|uniref:Uncharacterized protein n=1 Tax=Ferruginibacter yonginensis TaxID=1310416 RepID=A0ABV8QSB5_9BACT
MVILFLVAFNIKLMGGFKQQQSGSSSSGYSLYRNRFGSGLGAAAIRQPLNNATYINN